MDKHFNLGQWKTSTFLPTLGISLILTLGLLIFLSSIFNRIYLEKKAYKRDKTKFTITVSFKTLYTIFGVVFLLCGIIQSLIFLKGERGRILKYYINNSTVFIFQGTSRYGILYSIYNVTSGAFLMLVCFLLTDEQAKQYTKRKFSSWLESRFFKKENLNSGELFVKVKTERRQKGVQFNDIFIIEV